MSAISENKRKLSSGEMEATEPFILDETLYNRQLYVIGNDAMKSLSHAEVLLFGIGGLGAEIAKNLVLMGIKGLSVCDDNITTVTDVGLNCFLTNDDVTNELTRAQAACKKIQELNPYVVVSAVDNPLNQPISNDHFQAYAVVILTEMDLERCLEIDRMCHSLNSPVKVIMADVFGLVSWVFCDFGPSFEIKDPDGEEIKELTISEITSGKNGKVTVTNNHDYGNGDLVWFTDILGMESLNGTTHKIHVLSSKTFTFEKLRNNASFGNYIRGGMCKVVKQPVKVTFRSLGDDIWDPKYENIDSGKDEPAKNIHLSMLAIHNFLEIYGRQPEVQNLSDAENLIALAKDLNSKLKCPLDEINEEFLKNASFVAKGQLPAICAFLGGIVAQETVKAITGKFTPLSQWLHYDALELKGSEEFSPTDSRYDAILACLGKETMSRLADTKIFMIGCGAIGCEMLKNYAMLGIATRNGKIVITDHDLIEKSNLNRQFLFRNHHIQKPKSFVAASTILQINPDLKITANQTKVCPESESIYTEEFFEAQNLVINALDNLEARRYVDGRCVIVNKPLLESGTMGCKGHVQVILPHLTENYTAQSDPLDNDYPYCTIRSFPTQIEHAAQWAKEKFYSLFHQKPYRCLNFLKSNDVTKVIESLSSGQRVEGSYHVNKDMKNRPKTFADCLLIARLKFEKYFNHKAKNLLHFFPEDKVVEDGNVVMNFWQSPRRPPHPLDFDINNEMHYLFVLSASKLLAKAWNVPQTEELDHREIIASFKPPEFQPQDANIVTDESVVAPDPMQVDADEDTEMIAKELTEVVKDSGTLVFFPLSYDKDLDPHLDFVYSATNLRAIMHQLPEASRARVKRITGRIIPAISSTTSAVSGLVTIELIKVIMKMKSRSEYRNWYLNLAISSYISSEPAPPEQMELGPNVKYTAWDKWYIYGQHDVTLQRVLEMALEKCKLKPSMVVQGARIVWWPILPGHSNRLDKAFKELVDIEPNAKFVDLSFTFEVDEKNDVCAPLIRLFFQD